MAADPNLDLLEWFDESEREDCLACGERAVVGVSDAPLFRVCLGCRRTLPRAAIDDQKWYS
ncbi:MAG TPA: hypothetical protein VHQ89_08065 [Gaiellaceae bacterium]|nr:hypothetical protein [Gaiellaceae bacterium]